MRYIVKSLHPKDNTVHGAAMIEAQDAVDARIYYRAQLMETGGMTFRQVAALTVLSFPVLL
jgi:hypothetical protein